MKGPIYGRRKSSKEHLTPLLEKIDDDIQYVLLGEASHGTSEFYTVRSEFSKRLIKEKGFSFIAVEGDWPDCYKINRYVKKMPDSGTTAYDVLYTFRRWPTWMWANKEIMGLVEWLRTYNSKVDKQPPQQHQHQHQHQQEQQQQGNNAVKKMNKVGFYGLDLYSLWESMEAVIEYLKKVDPDALRAAYEAYNCFEPYGKSVENYARATAFVPESCKDEVIDLLKGLREKASEYSRQGLINGEEGEEPFFNAEQNAIVAKNAEEYYRTMIRGDVSSWNLRDQHMNETLENIIKFHNRVSKSNASKAIVWAHNTHIGDARYTDMYDAGMLNLGQLIREKAGRNKVILVGFGTYIGGVIAAEQWGEEMEIMHVPPAIDGSWDNLLHKYTNGKNKLFIFSGTPDGQEKNSVIGDDGGTDAKVRKRGQRAIGVVYHPQYEYGNYVPTILQKRYDAYVHVDETHALNPLHLPERKEEEEVQEFPMTYPTGL
jgi:erythromycin esterase